MACLSSGVTSAPFCMHGDDIVCRGCRDSDHLNFLLNRRFLMNTMAEKTAFGILKNSRKLALCKHLKSLFFLTLFEMLSFCWQAEGRSGKNRISKNRMLIKVMGKYSLLYFYSRTDDPVQKNCVP